MKLMVVECMFVLLVWTTHIGNDRWIRCATGSCKCRPETKSVSCWHSQMSVLPANQIIPHDIINMLVSVRHSF